MRERERLTTYIVVPGYEKQELDLVVGNPDAVQRDYEWFLDEMPFGPEIENHIDPHLTPDSCPLFLGRTTGEILFNMRRLQPQVYGHSQSVGELAVAIAEEVGTEEPLYEVKVAGDLHDVWKLGLRSLTDVKGPFTDEQRRQYHEHPTVGAALLSAWGYPVSVVNGARYHHCGLRYPLDASNYPPVPNEYVPRIGRIINLADYTVTALTQRSYKREVPINELEYIVYKAVKMGKVDADLADAFLRVYHNQGDEWMRHSYREEYLGPPSY